MASSQDDLLAPLMEQIQGALRNPREAADLLLQLVGVPVEDNALREQIIQLMQGRLLTRGIRRGEAAAVISKDAKGRLRVELRLRHGEDSESLGTFRIPSRPLEEAEFQSVAKDLGIVVWEDPGIFVVTVRGFDSSRN